MECDASTPATAGESPLANPPNLFGLCTYKLRARKSFRLRTLQTLAAERFCKRRAMCTFQTLEKKGGGGYPLPPPNLQLRTSNLQPLTFATIRSGMIEARQLTKTFHDKKRGEIRAVDG